MQKLQRDLGLDVLESSLVNGLKMTPKRRGLNHFVNFASIWKRRHEGLIE